MEDRIISYGGQAVIEGVMMRGQKAFAIAMRAPDGKIVIHREGLASVYRSKITKIPFLRGVILLWGSRWHSASDCSSSCPPRWVGWRNDIWAGIPGWRICSKAWSV